MAEEYDCMQLIDGEGIFHDTRFMNFMKKEKISYVVSIMGPQSSGKSTLLNHLFGTKFRVMDASKGRGKTTNGVWVAKSDIKPCTLVMDLEGSDGKERGENDTTNFEKWSSLFAIAISDIVLINMSCNEIGRENAASRPLLRTVFQAMLRICSSRNVTLMFVIRDKTETPPEILRKLVLEDIEEIWNSIGSGKGLKEFFDVKFEALCHYVYEGDQFKKEVAELKKKICGVDRDQRNVVPASVFSENAKEIWKKIKDDRNLNIPSSKVLEATYHCDKIVNEKFERFKRDYKAKMGSGKRFSSLLDTCLSEYDEATLYYDKVVRSEKRDELQEKLRRLKETNFDWNGWEATVAAPAATGLGAAATLVTALAIPGMQLVAVAMIPLIVGSVGILAAKLFTRGRIKEERVSIR